MTDSSGDQDPDWTSEGDQMAPDYDHATTADDDGEYQDEDIDEEMNEEEEEDAQDEEDDGT